MEAGDGQDPAVAALFEAAGLLERRHLRPCARGARCGGPPLSGAFPPLPHPEPKEENGSCLKKFDWMLARYQELSEAVSQPEIIADQAAGSGCS